MSEVTARSYAALIRTFNSAETLGRTLATLNAQTAAPHHIVIVDSGSTDGTQSLAPSSATLHQYEGSKFNYSAALNQGLHFVGTPYVLVISSHTFLENPIAIEFALNVLEKEDRIDAVYFSHENSEKIQFSVISANNFDGFNGIWNTCSIVRLSLLRERSFREDVFAAEDLEWSRWLLVEKKRRIARISGGGLVIKNKRYVTHGISKRLNDYVAVAYFANRKLLGVGNLARVAARAVVPRPSKPLREHLFWLRLLIRLLGCRIRAPRYDSRYY